MQETILCLKLVQPRKTCANLNEELLTGTYKTKPKQQAYIPYFKVNSIFNFACWVIFHAFLSSADFF